MILFAVIVLIFLLFSIKYPDTMFWVAVTILMDPGGYIQTYITRSMIGGIQLGDLMFVLLMIPLISPKIKLSYYFKYKDCRWIFNFLLIFMLSYHIFIYGYVMVGANFSTLLDFLQYERLTIVGFVVIIPGYIFFKRSYMLLIKFAFITSIALVLLYILTMFFNVSLLPIWTYERGLGTDATRISMMSYGFAYWFISISMVLLLYKINLPRKKWIFFIGITLFIAVILTLTRRSILEVIYIIFLIYFFHQKFTNQPVLSPRITKFIVAISFAVLVLYIIAPKYIGYSIEMIQNTISIAQNPNNQDNDVRLQHDIPNHIKRFKQSPLFGYGYDELWYSNDPTEGGLSANDTPLTAALGMFGIIGLFFYSFYYFHLYKIFFQTFKLLKTIYLSRQIYFNSFLFTICLILLVYFINRFTLNFLGYFGDLIQDIPRVKTMLLLGFLLASRDLLKLERINTVSITDKNELND